MDDFLLFGKRLKLHLRSRERQEAKTSQMSIGFTVFADGHWYGHGCTIDTILLGDTLNDASWRRKAFPIWLATSLLQNNVLP